MSKAFIYGGKRSAFGRHGGCLASLRPDDLVAQLIDAACEKSEIASSVDDVVLGCSNQAGEDSRNISRHAVLRSRLPEKVPGFTINRLCASGLSAVASAAQMIKAGDARLVLAGGVESMSRAPFVMAKANKAFDRSVSVFDTTLGARFANPHIIGEYGSDTMPETADNIAHDLEISRDASDQFAFQSQQKFEKARLKGFFDDEILPVEIPSSGRKKQDPVVVSADEHPRPNTSLDKLHTLKPLFAKGVVTAGNASGINDGAALLTVGDAQATQILNQNPLAEIIGCQSVGVSPRTMGLGPVGAIQKVLTSAELSLNDIDIFEINEAFAVQVLGCLQQLGLSPQDSRVNPNGGAIAVGHPLGASGARLTLTAARHLHATEGRYAVVSLCVGMGQGVAMLLKRVVSGQS